MRPRATQWSEALRVVDSRKGERRTEVQLRANGEETTADGIMYEIVGDEDEVLRFFEPVKEKLREEWGREQNTLSGFTYLQNHTDGRTQADKVTERSRTPPRECVPGTETEEREAEGKQKWMSINKMVAEGASENEMDVHDERLVPRGILKEKGGYDDSVLLAVND
ncbi:hypothetical protein R3P38DRAFT_2800233 [Favolaschia claudopus]|uniref:Uncharacterized protein n=1 Tax=Favolaschia claudopus TaxID=2862362 RepID=A0AAV9ZXC8_9AGAR